MKRVEVTTPHNVIITYDLAGFWMRFFAVLLDLLFKIIFASCFVFLIDAIGWGSEAIYTLFVLVFGVMYTFLSEGLFYGQTLAKLVLGIVVVRMDGQSPNWQDLLIRWSFRLIDFCGIGTLLIFTNDREQRVGGILSDTIVVKKEPSLRIRLDRIKKIATKSNYTPIYENVTQLRESDLLLIKEVLDRYKKYNNASHRKAIIDCANKIAVVLSVKFTGEPEAFLRTLVKDYIVLTR